MSKKHKEVCTALNYIQKSLILVAAITVCVSIFVFASLVNIPVGTSISPVGLKICAVLARIKKNN